MDEVAILKADIATLIQIVKAKIDDLTTQLAAAKAMTTPGQDIHTALTELDSTVTALTASLTGSPAATQAPASPPTQAPASPQAPASGAPTGTETQPIAN